MLRTKLLLGSVAASLFIAAPALAADAAATGAFGMAKQGNLIVSADRMFGLSFWNSKATDEPDPGDPPGAPKRITKESYTQFGLLWGGGPAFTNINPYNIPRASIDYTVIDGLTVGGSLGFLTASSKREDSTNPATTSISRDGPTYTNFVFAPRVGYILGFGPNLGLWLRGGLTYYYGSASSESVSGTGAVTKTKASVNGFALNLEPTFVISPVDHFGFYVGGVIDIPLTGTQKRETTGPTGATLTTEDGLTFFNAGVLFGFMGWL